VLTQALVGLPHERIYVVPAVRDLLHRVSRRQEGAANRPAEPGAEL
jgi:hypothetical protein